MKVFFLLLFSIVFFSSCGESKPESIELTINVVFPEGVNCKTYLADKFEINLFDSNQRKTDTRTFKCTEDSSSFSFFVVKDRYYMTVALKDGNNNNKSYGSGYVDASNSDVEIDIDMKEYQGGITFKWGVRFCREFDLEVLKFTLLSEEEPVSTIIWGKESSLKDYEIKCEAGFFEVVNIPAVTYSSFIEAFRTSSAGRPRVKFAVPEFKLVTGQDTPVNIDEYKEVVVSDIIVEWDFDSKSIDSCSTAGISKVLAEGTSRDIEENLEQNCDDTFSPFKFFDIPAGEFNVVISGVEPGGDVLFKGEVAIDVKQGSIGENALKYNVFIFEK